MMHLDDRALQWHQRFMKNQGQLFKVKWIHYIDDMRIRFGDNEYFDPMLDMVSLKQTAFVEEFYEEFKSLLNFQ